MRRLSHSRNRYSTFAALPVLDIVCFEEEDETAFLGLLQVEAA
jgi:hypothetical protein